MLSNLYNCFRASDVDISRSDTKPELKRLLRGLIQQIKDGTVAKKDGIGADLKRHVNTPSTAPIVIPSVDTPSNAPKQVQATLSAGLSPLGGASRTPLVISPQTQLNRTSYANIPNASPSNAKRSPNKRSDGGPGTDRTFILEEGFELASTDLAAPLAVSKLESTYPQIQPRMLRYYQAITNSQTHLAPVPSPLVQRNSFEPPALHYVGEYACIVCGNRSVSSCKFRRCRNCCNANSLSCTVHAIGHDALYAMPRPLERTGAPGTIATAQAGLTKVTRRTAPSVPKMLPNAVLGETESPNPWPELREEASYRLLQNTTCMDTIFDHHSLDSLRTWLKSWQSTSLASIQERKQTIENDIETMEHTHAELMDAWLEDSRLFKQRLGALEDLGNMAATDENQEIEEQFMQIREEFLAKVDAQIQVPIAPRKRPYRESVAREPSTKRRVTEI